MIISKCPVPGLAPSFNLVAWTTECVLVGGLHVRTQPADEIEIREHMPDVPFLHNLHVRKRYRHRGVGSQLLAVAESIVSEWGSTRIAMAVAVNNSIGLRWYMHLGYSHWPYDSVACLTENNVLEMCYVIQKPLEG